MTKSENLKVPAQAPGGEPAVHPSGEPQQYEFMVAAHLITAAPGRYLEGTKFEGSMGGASYELYQRLAPRDTLESILALLTVSVTNMSLDCLALAARVPPDYLEARELNLRYGLKAAEVVAQLIKAQDDRHREKPDKVSVGTVNVETGGQAIVGNVKSGADSVPTKGAKD
jgi:hypothetical protein